MNFPTVPAAPPSATRRTLVRITLAGLAAALVLAIAAGPGGTAPPPAKPEFPHRMGSDTAGNSAAPRLSPAIALGDSNRRPADMPPRPAPPARVVVAVDTTNGPLVSTDIPGYWRTRAERTAWKQTSDYDETMRYCRQLEAGSRWVRLVTYGTSGQGRDLPMLVLSKDRAFTPEEARANGKPIVLIQNGIHAGEIEGKDASLALARDMTVLRTRMDLLDSCTVLILPIFSVDAHERRSKYNRINQNGPEEMGWRVTPIGLNLNRDYTKAETPEMQALIGNVYTRWWPDLLVDDHTTDGADYQHDVTYGIPHGPQVPPSLERWLADAFEGRVIPRLAALGHLPAPYLSFRRGNDPRSGIDFGNTPPRFSTGYTILQCRPSILVETHMLKPYGYRVRATYDLLAALLEELHARPRALTSAVLEAERATLARARATTPAGRTVVLDTHTSDTAVPFAFRGRQTTWAKSEITGSMVAHYSSAPWDSLVPLYRDVVAGLTVAQPAGGYLVPQEWAGVVELLRVQGIATRRLARAWRDTVEVTRVTGWKAAADIVEGHHPISVSETKSERQLRTYRAGDVWVPLDQRGGALAVNLLEARAPDGVLAWNFFDTIFMRKEYGEDYVVEPLARQMLAKDPALAKEFAAKLAADSTFANSAFARSEFFYRRSPWADPEQNLLPVARLLAPVPESYLVPAGTVAPAPKR